eukprot:1181037-Prorocentrum_minimum.AAC.2
MQDAASRHRLGLHAAIKPLRRMPASSPSTNAGTPERCDTFGHLFAAAAITAGVPWLIAGVPWLSVGVPWLLVTCSPRRFPAGSPPAATPPADPPDPPI